MLTVRADILDALWQTLQHLLIIPPNLTPIRGEDRKRIRVMLGDLVKERFPGRAIGIDDGSDGVEVFHLPQASHQG